MGGNVSEEERILFESNRAIFDVGVYKRLGKNLFVGGEVSYFGYRNVSTAEGNPLRELRDAWDVGVSGTVFTDSRNSLLSATCGRYSQVILGYNCGTKTYADLEVDFRRYFTFKRDVVLAARFYNSFIFGTPNFYDYSVLGGDDFVRGYFYVKYRDNNLSTLQGELRTPLLWRLGLAVIAGGSSVYNTSSVQLRVRPDYGLGLRILLDKKDKVNLRFDYVLGNEGNSGSYIGFGESF